MKFYKKISVFIDKVIDDVIIDGLIMGSCKQFVQFGKKVATIQNANVRFLCRLHANWYELRIYIFIYFFRIIR